ncbi:MAG: hypothetical protein KGM44_00055 [bacterium]|nr:hypothetical protein [bacterium]
MDYAEPTAEERQRAANAYAFWILAVPELGASARPGSAWFRGHIRQALMLGLAETAILIGVLAAPALLVGLLLLVHVPLTARATVWIYAAGFLIDAGVFVLAVALGFSLAARAARGERFSVAFVRRARSR